MQETDIVTYVASQEIFDKIYNFLNGKWLHLILITILIAIHW